jgi:hypothetical protein
MHLVFSHSPGPRDAALGWPGVELPPDTMAGRAARGVGGASRWGGARRRLASPFEWPTSMNNRGLPP